MNDSRWLMSAVVGLALAGCASAAEAPAEATQAPSAGVDESQYPPPQARPSDDDYTRRASLLLIQAQNAGDPTRTEELARQAVAVVEEGLQQDSMNPKLWLLLGQTQALAGESDAADEAFDRAQEIYPAYEVQIRAERESAWVEQFRRGTEAMEADREEEAIAHFEAAQRIYTERPEALMNLASLYVNRDQPDRAVAAYEQVLEIVEGPIRQEFSEEITADWDRYATMARANIPRLRINAGIEHFRAERYDEALDVFGAVVEMNPYSYDALNLLTQTYYVMTADLEEELDTAAEAEQQTIRERLGELYPRYVEIAERFREIDAYNQNTLALLGRAYRGMSRFASAPGEEDQWSRRALAVLEEGQALPVQITNVRASLGEGQMSFQGDVVNRTMSAGEAVRFRIELLDPGGQQVGSQEFSVQLGEPNTAAPFEVIVSTTGEAVGWTFELLTD
ncbi:MAG: tetratricopeptide repeat protein [Longimicrobiales bacterium]